MYNISSFASIGRVDLVSVKVVYKIICDFSNLGEIKNLKSSDTRKFTKLFSETQIGI